MIILDVNKLSKNFGYGQLFLDVSFSLNEGESISIVGPNGCGKSTLLKMIAGLEKIDSGSVSIMKGAKVAYLDQTGSSIDDDRCVYDVLKDAFKDLTEIAGQKPVLTYAKKSIATFKVRAGMAIGCKVTLRREKMYEFLDRLITMALPRVRDFRGVSKNAFDGHGNYTLGVKEQLIFPEIEYDKVSKIRGMDIVIVTTATTDEEAYSLLELIGMPFHK